jgi:catechol 2,3-dioxygenase-like lactoylglutathione lyase family enzyme
MTACTIKRTFHTGFCVGDLDWTIGFFQQVLGFTLIDKAPRDSRNQSFVTGVPGAQVMIAYMDGAGHSLDVVDDVDEVVAACRRYDDRIRTLSPRPLEVDQGPNKGNKIQFVVLPDGVHIEFTTRVND